jgi:hypothetical protein
MRAIGLLDDIDNVIQYQSAYLCDDASALPLIFDTGASIGVTPCADDFVAWEPMTQKHYLNELSNVTQVKGVGIARWIVRDDSGARHEIQQRAYYIPEAHMRLMSPQRFLSQHKSGQFTIYHDRAVFEFPNSRGRLTFRAGNTGSDIPYTFPVCRHQREHNRAQFADAIANCGIFGDDNTNVTPAQKELMSWHCRLGHFHFGWIQRLTRVREGEPTSVKGKAKPYLATRHYKTPSCEPPMCHACLLG